MTPTQTDYDSPWKELLDPYFRPFLELFFPTVAQAIDWERGYEFLDKEFQRIALAGTVGRRYADKLVKVWRRTGEETWVLIHIEIQGQRERAFGERMFTYYYRLFDRYGHPLASLVVLADDQPGWRPSGYQRELWGCRLTLEFPVVKLLDYREREAELAASANPLAVVVEAHLAALATQGNPEQRLARKLGLTRRLYRRGWSRADVLQLYRFMDWVLALPEALEQQYLDEVYRLEEETHMRYVTSAERIGLKRGLQQGVLKGEAKVVQRQLQRRFGPLPEWVEERLQGAGEAQLERWAERLLEAPTLAEVFAEAGEG